jgi:hypothetical protein
MLIPLYSAATIGNPFALPYSYQASFPQMKSGLYAIQWPNLENFGRLMVGPTRGLLFWSPFLLMASVGAWQLSIGDGFKRFQFEKAWIIVLVIATPLVHMMVISGRTWDWQAGLTLSARYMAPVLPLMALPCALGVFRFPTIGALLALLSVILMSVATLTDACPDYLVFNPLIELHIPLLIKGEFSPNLGMLLGMPPFISVLAYFLILLGGVFWLFKRINF